MKNVVFCGDVMAMIAQIPDNSIQCVVTSPPYWGLRDYGHNGQIGLEKTPEEYVDKLRMVFFQIKRVLKDDGTVWLNLGDSYASDSKGSGDPSEKQISNGGSRYLAQRFTHGLKPKDLVGIPWRVAFALQADGWWLRQDIIWAKPNPMPESVTDRCTKSHEYIFLLTKSARYYYDLDAVMEPSLSVEYDERPFGIVRDRIFGYDSKQKILRTKGGRGGFGSPTGKNNDSIKAHSNDCGKAWTPSETRNKRSVWPICTTPYSGAHFATFPEEIPTICIRAGSKPGDIILDPFAGSGTTLEVAKRLGRDST